MKIGIVIGERQHTSMREATHVGGQETGRGERVVEEDGEALDRSAPAGRLPGAR